MSSVGLICCKLCIPSQGNTQQLRNITLQCIVIHFTFLYYIQNQINHVEYDSIEAGLLQIRGLLLKLQSNIINFCTKHYFKYKK